MKGINAMNDRENLLIIAKNNLASAIDDNILIPYEKSHKRFAVLRDEIKMADYDKELDVLAEKIVDVIIKMRRFEGADEDF